jgi:hypothetical protein
MNERSSGGAKAHGPALAVLCALVALPAAAQTAGPTTTQQLFLDTASASAAHGNYLEATAGLIYTTNVTLTPNGTGDELYAIGLIGNMDRQGAPRFDYHLDSDLTLIKYGSGAYPIQPFGFFDAFGDFKIDPGFFSWTGRETFTQALLQPLAPATPDNIESLNLISTGPRLHMQPTLRTTITINGYATWVDSTTKSTLYDNINNHRWGGDFNVNRAFNNSLSAYIGGNYMDVKFQDTQNNTDFVQKQLLAGIKVNAARTYLDASGGYTWVDLDNPEKQQAHGLTWDISLSRLISPTQRISVYWLNQFTDAANLFYLNINQPVPGGGQNTIATGQPFSHREVGGDWRVQESRTTFELGAQYYQERYQETPESDRNVTNIYGLASRELNESVTVNLGAGYVHQDFLDGTETKNLNVWASVRWRVGPRVALRFLYAYSSLTPNGYVDNQVGVTVLYALTQQAQAADERMSPMKTTAPTYQPN